MSVELICDDGLDYIEICHVYLKSNRAMILTDCTKWRIQALLRACERYSLPMINAWSEKWLKPGKFPGEKRIQPYQAIIRAFPDEKLIVDPFMGSGTTGLAAVLEGRDFIGIEINPERFAYAKSRIEDAVAGAVTGNF